jgi:hypothetical protein
MSRKSDNWFHWEPETEERMTHLGKRYTTCEVLRQAYSKTKDPEVRELLKIATTMAKSMAGRLYRHEGKGWGTKIYPLNPLWVEMQSKQPEIVVNDQEDFDGYT